MYIRKFVYQALSSGDREVQDQWLHMMSASHYFLTQHYNRRNVCKRFQQVYSGDRERAKELTHT